MVLYPVMDTIVAAEVDTLALNMLILSASRPDQSAAAGSQR